MTAVMLRILALLFALATTAVAREFDPRRDAFSFSNDTVLNYEVTPDGRLLTSRKAKSDRPTHCCFLFTRSAMQFWKFARFEPRQPRLSEAEYRKRIIALFRIAPWVEREERIVFPGYADLWSFSKAHEKTIRDNIGSWLLTYLRVGNWRVMNPVIRWRQHSIAETLFERVSRGEIRAMYLSRLPHMNHVVLVYHAERLHGDQEGGMKFRVYDANFAGKSMDLGYVAKSSLFTFPKCFYWPGGELRGMPVYDRPLH
jgi:hypothetical protein